MSKKQYYMKFIAFRLDEDTHKLLTEEQEKRGGIPLSRVAKQLIEEKLKGKR